MAFIDEDLLFKLTPIEQISPRGWPRYASFQLPVQHKSRLAYFVAD